MEKVPVRELWPREDYGFTPWLADNINVLGDALGLDIELVSLEAPVGFSALDILACDRGDDRLVAIENQFGTSDDDHLERLQSYASHYDANVKVLISEKLTYRHMDKIDQFNRRNDGDRKLYGVVIEAWKEADSAPMPFFRVLSAPNHWPTPPAPLGKGVRLLPVHYRQFFKSLVDVMREEHNLTKARVGTGVMWQSFPTGVSGISYICEFLEPHARLWNHANRRLADTSSPENTIKSIRSQDYVAVKLYITGGDEKVRTLRFDRLRAHKFEIEADLGYELIWLRDQPRRASVIMAVSHTRRLDEVLEWMETQLLAFTKTFGPRLGEISDVQQ